MHRRKNVLTFDFARGIRKPEGQINETGAERSQGIWTTKGSMADVGKNGSEAGDGGKGRGGGGAKNAKEAQKQEQKTATVTFTLLHCAAFCRMIRGYCPDCCMVEKLLAPLNTPSTPPGLSAQGFPCTGRLSEQASQV